MKFEKVTPFVARSECGAYAICANASDLYTPWHLEHGQWTHIDGRGCDTAKEAAQVCERHSQKTQEQSA